MGPTDLLLQTIPAEVLPTEYGGISSFVLPHSVDVSSLDSCADNVGSNFADEPAIKTKQVAAGPCDSRKQIVEPTQAKSSMFVCWKGLASVCFPCERSVNGIESPRTMKLYSKLHG